MLRPFYITGWVEAAGEPLCPFPFLTKNVERPLTCYSRILLRFACQKNTSLHGSHERNTFIVFISECWTILIQHSGIHSHCLFVIHH